MRRFALVVGPCTLIGLAAVAGPLDRSLVAPGAGWVIHLDLEAAVGGSIGKHVLANPDKFPREGGLDDLKAFGLDPLKDIMGVTIFGVTKGKEDGVVLVEATQAVENLWNMIKGEGNAKMMTVEGVEILSWDDKGERKYGVMKPGKTPERRMVYIAEDWSTLATAVNGAGKGVKPKDLPGPGTGSVLYAEASVIPDEFRENDDPNASAVLKALRSGWLDVGETDKTIYAKVTANFSDAATAANMRQVLDGLMAFGRLATGQNPELAEVSKALAGIKVEAGDAAVTIVGGWAAQDAIKALDAAAAMDRDHDDHDDHDDTDHDDHDDHKGGDKDGNKDGHRAKKD